MTVRVKEWIQHIEETEHRTPDPKVIQGIVLLDKIAIAFKIMGQKDAAEGNEVFTTEKFMEWGSKYFPNDPETAECLAELMQLHYMDGYNGGSA